MHDENGAWGGPAVRSEGSKGSKGSKGSAGDNRREAEEARNIW